MTFNGWIKVELMNAVDLHYGNEKMIKKIHTVKVCLTENNYNNLLYFDEQTIIFNVKCQKFIACTTDKNF